MQSLLLRIFIVLSVDNPKNVSFISRSLVLRMILPMVAKPWVVILMGSPVSYFRKIEPVQCPMDGETEFTLNVSALSGSRMPVVGFIENSWFGGDSLKIAWASPRLWTLRALGEGILAAVGGRAIRSGKSRMGLGPKPETIQILKGLHYFRGLSIFLDAMGGGGGDLTMLTDFLFSGFDFHFSSTHARKPQRYVISGQSKLASPVHIILYKKKEVTPDISFDV